MANEAVGVASSPSTQVVACHNMLRIQMKTAWNPHTDRQRDKQTDRQIYRETERQTEDRARSTFIQIVEQSPSRCHMVIV